MNPKDHTISAFWWHVLFIVIAVIATFLLTRPETAGQDASGSEIGRPVEHEHLQFYETAKVGWMGYAGNEIIAEVSYYTNREIETDNTPNITASGKRISLGMAANNCLPFNSKVEIDGKIFEIQDRMARRYDCDNFDIFTPDLKEAIAAGRETKIIRLVD